MIQMQGNNIMRNYVKIGWIEGSKFFDHTGQKLGYVSGNVIFDHTDKKLAYLDGEFVYIPWTTKKTRVEDEIVNINAGLLSDVMRVAIKFFFGD